MDDGCGSALPKLVPLFNVVEGKSIPACKVILRAGRNWKGIGNAWDDCLCWGCQSGVMVTSTPDVWQSLPLTYCPKVSALWTREAA
eukprot:1161814-Pelagomonas_calceolata.AAC.15